MYFSNVGGDIHTYAEFNLIGSPKDKIACDFGISSTKAIEFAYKFLTLYGGELFRMLVGIGRPLTCAAKSAGFVPGAIGVQLTSMGKTLVKFQEL